MMPRTISIIIVTWNTRDFVLNAVGSAVEDMRRSGIFGDIWVVDNQSTDGTAEALRRAYPETFVPTIHVLDAPENLGFARANNYALRAIGFPQGANLPEYVLLLNPDTVVGLGALGALLDGMEATGAGLSGAQLKFGDGTFQHSAFMFPGLVQLYADLFPVPARLYESRLNGRYPRGLYDQPQPFVIDHPLGATFLLRREVIQQVGMFDEQFHLYCEEVDWAMRIKSAGWQAICVPSAEIVHYGGQSTSQVRPQSVINLWKARLQLFRKHYNPIKLEIAKILIRLGMNRFIRQTARDSSQSEESRFALIQAYTQVIKLTRSL